MSAQLVDQFEGFQDVVLSGADTAALKKMPEADVKDAFAEILDEPFVAKDWGGELSDLYTTGLTVNGESLAAAFAFKGGPGAPKPELAIGGMGKNGDQGVRLFHEPADVMVVQYHGGVSTPVRALMEALARQHRKRFMILDGKVTARILKAHSKL